MNEKQKTQLEMIAKYQEAALGILKDILNGKKEETEEMDITGIVSDVCNMSSMMGKIVSDEDIDNFTENEFQMYSQMIMMYMMKSVD